MKITVVGGEEMKAELLSEGIKDGVELVKNAEIVINLEEGIVQFPSGNIRFNNWPGFLKGRRVEVVCKNTEHKIKAEEIFSSFNKIVESEPDIPGFIAARIVSMIINEAFFALEEKVSSKEEIDTAMKLGTNYPFGPFEWAEKIGLKKIFQLLSELSKTQPRYEPASLLKKQALAS